MLSNEQKAKLHAMRIAMDGGVTLAAAQGTAAINSVTALIRMWKPGAYVIGDVRAEGGVPYKCVQAHTSQASWTPDATPALWGVVSIDEYPEWVRPTGAHDAYNTGDKVSYNGKHYVCTADANIYAPDVYGWEET